VRRCRPDLAALPGRPRFDPWCLTDRSTLRTWQRDPRAIRAVNDMWRFDPDPALTLMLKAELDAGLRSGDLALYRTGQGGTCYYECPWSALYEVRRPVRISRLSLKPLQQFAVHVSADGVLRGGAFQRGLVFGPFQPTYGPGYCSPAGRH
jgi:hypothetical protein